jgi:hypothetical protein
MKPNDLGIARDQRALEALFAELEAGSRADETQRTLPWPRSTGRGAQFVEALVVCAAVLYFAGGAIAILLG